jgi:hypothetical protein
MSHAQLITARDVFRAAPRPHFLRSQEQRDHAALLRQGARHPRGHAQSCNRLNHLQVDTVQLEKDSWAVTLGGRAVRTPGGHALTVPTPALASAVALEWDYQVCVRGACDCESLTTPAQGRHIRPTSMPVVPQRRAALRALRERLTRVCRRRTLLSPPWIRPQNTGRRWSIPGAVSAPLTRFGEGTLET